MKTSIDIQAFIKCLFPRIFNLNFMPRITTRVLLPRLTCLSQIYREPTGLSPIEAFTQYLTDSQRKEFLNMFDNFCDTNGLTFSYPVHGGFMGSDAKIKSFGITNKYTSLAPEFNTYDTIKELAQTHTEVSIVCERASEIETIGEYLDTDMDISDIVSYLNVTHIFRGWWTWTPCVNSCSSIPEGIEYPQDCNDWRYSYEHLSDAVTKANTNFCGAVPAQRINFVDYDPILDMVYQKSDTEEMALDPEKWGLPISKDAFQAEWRKHITPKDAYFPDITNSDFQDLLFHWIERQVQCGVNQIWVDMFFMQANLMNYYTEDPTHPAVEDAYNASSSLINRIRNNLEIPVGTWSVFLDLPYTPPSLDFLTLSPTGTEVAQLTLNEEEWTTKLDTIRNNYPSAEIICFLDWGGG